MRTPITYYGGKQTLAPTIVSMLPPHRIYCEPFFGGGAVFFAKPKSYLEAINDTNDRLVTFYKQVMTNFDELQQMVQNTLQSESEYLKAREIYNRRRPASDAEIAWAVWMVTNFSFSGSPRGGWKWDNGNAGSHVGIYICAAAVRSSQAGCATALPTCRSVAAMRSMSSVSATPQRPCYTSTLHIRGPT